MGDLRCGAGGRAVPDGVEEVGHVLGIAGLAAEGFAFGRAWLGLRSEEHAEGPAARKDHVALGAVEDVAVVEAVQAIRP